MRSGLIGISHIGKEYVLPLSLNRRLLQRFVMHCGKNVVGGEEDGIRAKGTPAEKLYTTPEDMLEVTRRLGAVKGALFLLAATFGNVHGVYKLGNVKFKPSIIKDSQAAVLLWRHTGHEWTDKTRTSCRSRSAFRHSGVQEESRLMAAASAR